MPISVTCDGCGKTLKVKDEWAGKRGKCPGCGKTFPIPAAGSASAAPAARGAKAAGKPQKKGGGVAVSWGTVILVVCAIAVPVAIAVIYFGPVRTWHEWQAIGEKADYDVKDVVTLAIQSYLSENGGYDPGKPHFTPTANDVGFIFPPTQMSMPERVKFKGSSTEGPFEGYYHPKTGEVEADVDIGGTSINGLGAVRKGNKTLKVTGRMVDKHAQAEIGGKKAEIHYRKHDDDN